MEKFDFLTYMLQCAEELKELKHGENYNRFFRITGLTQLEELLFNLSDANYPAMMVENNQVGNLTDRGSSDNVVDVPYHTFMIIEKAEFNDHDAVEAAKASCKAIGLKIISRLIRDKRRMLNGLVFLDVSGIAYDTFGPIADNTYGVSFSFTVPWQADVTFNSADWLT
jgi:hypothetical protein